MYLAEALGLTEDYELDPNKPLVFGNLELGLEATSEATRLLSGASPPEVDFRRRQFCSPVYWSVNHKTAGSAEIFGFPGGTVGSLPTAIEIAIVRAIAGTPPDDHNLLFEGNTEIVLGPRQAWSDFRRVFGTVRQPLVGNSLLFGGATDVVVEESASLFLTDLCLNCLENSFNTSPLKFRFLELYRMMEARFLAVVKKKLLDAFDSQPGVALQQASNSLKNEISLIKGLAEIQQNAFEACWSAINQLKNGNQFAAALFRRAQDKTYASGSRWENGAVLIYQIRCAIVHAGQRDLIFERFSDSEDVLKAVIEHIERAALLLVGIDVILEND
ncbi:hypothetical protein [Phenylobacterium sp.]|uniref:hypothetical protein n=1 Tax=Phenylobacterium sp. TaxID=1871053 RepID=UPI0025DF10A5|nr:hypothetical protein [Phenylobacterium sp.]MCA6261992.1 hypothetical protein [Phenylobacterium sp.]